jgi:glycogenin glucosyltransferase
MAFPYAFVTLLTSDYYLPGALTLAAALRDVHPSPALPPEVDFQTVCLVTPETVDIASIKLLRKAFDVVVGVEIIEEGNERGLQLLGMSSSTWLIYLLFLYLCYTPEHEHRAPTLRGIRLSRQGVRFVVTF